MDQELETWKEKIPKNWEVKKLGELCNTTSGGTPSRGNKNYYNGNIPWVKSGELEKGIIYDTEEKISEDGIKTSSAKIFPKGTLLIALYGATIGKLAFLGVDAATNQAICGIFKSDQLDSNYLYYYLFFCKPKLINQGIGGAQPNISQAIIRSTPIPLPPIAEQQTIVAKIEELFSELEKGKEQLETALAQLKVYQQSLLQAAFTGKLTNPGVMEGELPEGWKWVKLGEVCEKIQDGSHFSPQNQAKDKFPGSFLYITAKNIQNGYMDLRNLVYIDKEFFDSIYSRCNPESGDVLLTKDGVNAGEVTINTLNEPFALLSSVCLIKPSKSILLSKYLMYYIQSPIGNRYLIGDMTGTAIKRIILKKIKLSLLVLTKITEQEQIVQILESKLTVCDKIEETIKKSLAQAEVLRQSILKQAFEGKLVLHIQTEIESVATEKNDPLIKKKQKLRSKTFKWSHLF
ncbi:restriction endonuclease subunit S [Leptospira sp. 96542]|nr:restriction endonuclease subunit S [Leptospira sp. 96542]